MKPLKKQKPQVRRTKWVSLGGDIEASYDGGKYIDLKTAGDNKTRIFMSKGALLRALALMADGQ